MTKILIVNASKILTDEEATLVVSALQKWDDTMVAPAWRFEPCVYAFSSWADFESSQPDDVWPIFLNRHSTDLGALGWHDDQSGRIFGRIFVGDCLRYGVSWTVDVSHEAAEMRGDPTIDQTVTLPDGRIALKELCDPVEDDLLAIDVDGVKLSDFVLPTYFGLPAAVGWGNRGYDFQAQLKGPCPTLTSGGYQSLLVNGQWTQVTARLLGGPCSYRSERFNAGSHRRRGIGVAGG